MRSLMPLTQNHTNTSIRSIWYYSCHPNLIHRMYETLNINKERLLLPDVFKCQDLHDLTTFLLAYHTHLPQAGLLPVPRNPGRVHSDQIPKL